MPKALDLTGQRFGKLVALKKSSSKSGKTYWLCKCDCGNEKEVQTTHLRNGSIQSCGCLKLEKSKGSLTCPICGKSFESNNHMRKYCYDCAPSGQPPKDRLKRINRLIKHNLIEYKGGKCEMCGYDKCEGALQFHHINPEQKEFSLSETNNHNLSELKLEADKCMLLCANCHAEQHYSED